jgi:hypothetical protein
MSTLQRFAWFCGVAALAGALGGCYAYAEPGYVEADYVPPDITVYPSAFYEGQTVYLVDGRWYFRNHDQWVIMRDEPHVLYNERVRIQAQPGYGYRQNAPRAYPAGRYNAPPAPRYNAPPAYRAPPPRPHPRHNDDRYDRYDRR